MTRRTPWDNEESGALLVAGLLGGEFVKRDVPGAPPSTHDYDIVLPDGSVVALEITQQAAGKILAQRALEEKLEWTDSELGHDWVVKVREPTDMIKLHKAIPGLLRRLEAKGVDSIVVGADDRELSIQESLARLGIRLVYRLQETSDGGSIIVGSAPATGSTHPDLVAAVAEDHANRADNVKKLNRAQASERHLLVWIHADLHQLTAAMGMGDLPDREVLLGDAIDAVWIASAYERPTVWRYNEMGWTDRTRS